MTTLLLALALLSVGSGILGFIAGRFWQIRAARRFHRLAIEISRRKARDARRREYCHYRLPGSMPG